MNRFGSWNEILFGVGLAVLAAAVLALALAFARPPQIDLGYRDARFTQGFHAPEPATGPYFRWTTAQASLAIPRTSSGGAAIFAMRVLPGRPLDQPEARLSLTSGDTAVGSFTIIGRPQQIRRYRILVPPDDSLGWASQIGLASDTITLPNDPRALGVVVDTAGLERLTGGLALPPLWPLLWGAVFTALLFALLRSVGATRPGATLVTVFVALGLAAMAFLRPLDLLPFVQRLAALPALALLAVWIGRLLAPPNADRGASTVPGAALPVYFAAMWWMGPLVQLVLVADGVEGIAPDTATLLIGGALVLSLLAVVGGWYARVGRTVPPPARRAELLARALPLLAAAALAHFIFMLWFAFQRQGPDFWLLFKGAREFARGGSLYDIAALTADPFSRLPLKVPPVYGMLFVPFVFQDGERILLFHRLINCGLLVWSLVVWVRMWRIPVRSAALLGLVVLLNYRPIADTIAFGQIDIALLACLTLALWALREQRDLLAGVAVAFGTMFKIYPVLLLPFFVVKRRWQGLVGFALGMVLLNGWAIFCMGWPIHREFLFEVFPRIGGTTPWVENQSISGVLARLVAAPNIDSFRDPLVAMIVNAIAAVLMLAVSALALRPVQTKSTAFALQYGQYLLLMVLIIPASWMHYETLLVLPYAALLLHLWERRVDLRLVALLALSFALTGYGNQWSFYSGTVTGALTIAGISYKFYGMVLLGGVLLGTLLRERGTAIATAESGGRFVTPLPLEVRPE